MAKDGTNRGGLRAGAGRKRKALEEKILDGTAIFAGEKSKKNQPKIKPPKKFLTSTQKDGGKLQSKKIYEELSAWLSERGCESLLPQQLIEDYAQAVGRHIQCEEYLSEYGLIARHPTTGEPIISPFFKMNNDCIKLSSLLWNQIFSAVRDNAPQGVLVREPMDEMEELFRRMKQ